ncbi:TadE/TadG family type IV pilus assembly protein [Sphingomonas sp. Mn802worker]|uniref:TadE/TadG family type IV pilus assembly protein n=1 Tax=Sphingomonas sp. Mn802worker TaxID=629773 RepID=UPI0003712DAB|nr:TadE family protein [Sphingomonas sp. Mn802worker]
MIRRFVRRLRRDRRGVTIIEFAIVTPVLFTMLMGLFDLMYRSYAQTVLDGAMYKAGRDSALETNASSAAAMDAKVIDMVSVLGPGMKFQAMRRSYSSYLVAKPENFTDKNGNGVRDPGECFDDVNGNQQWDADPGQVQSQGGANDVTRYTMTVTYPRIFPVAGLLGLPTTQTISSETFLKNQPYKTQVVQPVQSICT